MVPVMKALASSLAEFLGERRELLPGEPTGSLTLCDPGEGSSGEMMLVRHDGEPLAMARRCKSARIAKRLLWAHGLAAKLPRTGEPSLTPRLIASDMSRRCSRAIGGPLIIEEWIAGDTLTGKSLAECASHAHALARALARLHGLRSRVWRDRRSRGRRKFHPRLQRMFVTRLADLAGRNDLLASQDASEILAAVDRTLAAISDHTDFALVHTCIAPSDLIVRPGGDVTLIDIGTLQFGPPELDLAAAICAAGLDDTAGGALLEPYLAERPESERHSLRTRLPIFRALFELSKIRARVRAGDADSRLSEVRAHAQRLLAWARNESSFSPSGKR
jgi:aminoglycoside phosphotransferase (APT) family kinase protein